MRHNKRMWIVWALLFMAVCTQRVDAGIVRSPAYASEPQRLMGTILLCSTNNADYAATVVAGTEAKEHEGVYPGKGYARKEQELWSHEYTLDELESEARKIRKEQNNLFKEKRAVRKEWDRLFALKTQMHKQGRPAAEQEEIESQIREINAQKNRFDIKINEYEPELQKLEQEIAKVEQWILDVKVTADDSENYINELYDRRILIRPNNKAKYEQERNTWLKLKNKPGGKGPRQKGKGGASVS